MSLMFMFVLFQESLDIQTTDTMISYLPLAHMYERVSEVSSHTEISCVNDCISGMNDCISVMNDCISAVP